MIDLLCATVIRGVIIFGPLGAATVVGTWGFFVWKQRRG